MNKMLISLLVIALSSLSASAQQQDSNDIVESDSVVSIKWLNQDKYTDVRPSNESKSRFKKRVFSELTEQFEKSAAKTFPEGYHLKIDMLNVDLAGDIDYFFSPSHQAVRVIKEIYSPKLTFNYQLLDGNGTVIKAGEEKVRDMGFMNSSVPLRHRNSEFSYEKRLIDKWVKTLLSE